MSSIIICFSNYTTGIIMTRATLDDVIMINYFVIYI